MDSFTSSYASAVRTGDPFISSNRKSLTMIKAIRLVMIAAVGIAAGIAVCKMNGSSVPMVDETLDRMPAGLVSWTGLQSSDPVVLGPWPPQVGERYPDLLLDDSEGNRVRLSDLSGKTILLELAAIPCKGCQAFAGGKRLGGYGGFGVQRDLDSIHEYTKRFAGVKLGKDVVFVQLLLYGEAMSAPSKEEVAGWTKHFQLDQTPNTIVLRGDASMLGPQTYAMIPGFHLIDRDFNLRYDSSGHHPKHDLFRELLPALGTMVR